MASCLVIFLLNHTWIVENLHGITTSERLDKRIHDLFVEEPMGQSYLTIVKDAKDGLLRKFTRENDPDPEDNMDKDGEAAYETDQDIVDFDGHFEDGGPFSVLRIEKHLEGTNMIKDNVYELHKEVSIEIEPDPPDDMNEKSKLIEDDEYNMTGVVTDVFYSTIEMKEEESNVTVPPPEDHEGLE